MIHAEKLSDIYKSIRNNIASFSLPEADSDSLGKGEEIKAASVDKGKGFWGRDSSLRDAVREVYLDLPDVTYFLVCVDKKRHKYRYGKNATAPSQLGLQFLLERIQGFLDDKGEFGIVFIDANRLEEVKQRGLFERLLKWGSKGIAVSKHFGVIYEWRLNMEKILEIHFADSKYSLGIQIADFVARHAYSWWKKGKASSYPGWSLIEQRLYKYPKHLGWGFKEFPEE